MNWKQITLTILGLILVLFGINDPMLLIFPMWIFTYLLKNKLILLLNRFPLPVAFIGAGVFFGLATEVFAILNNISVPLEQRILISPDPVLDLIYGFFYYLLLIFTWYILLRKIKYSKKEVFLITGLLGVFTEEGGQVFLRILSSPIEGFLYAIIIMFVYGLFPMLAYLLCEERFENKQKNLFLRYGFAIVVLFLQWAIYGIFLLPILKAI